jgi:UDP:flavonoid glycosyltransferase YjiC (YdhE family)
VRILFTFVGGTGHYEPLVPIARAAVANGHTITVACRASMVPVVEADGFVAVAIGPDVPDLPAIAPLVPIDEAHEEQVMRYGFAGTTARLRAADVVRLCGDDRPDAIVSDEVDFGAVIAAESLGIAHVTVLVLLTGSFARHEVIADALNDVRSAFDLPPDPELVMLRRHLVIAPFPASLRDPTTPLPDTAHLIRPAALGDNTSVAATDSTVAFAEAIDGPTVYFTLGTIFNMESGDLFSRVLAGLRGCRVNVIATVGRQLDPAMFGPQPPHVLIERYIPQATVLPHCDVVISHGGGGSVLGALAYGLPSVLLPMGADQPHNVRRCAQLGVAVVVDPVGATSASIRDAVNEVLNNPSYRQRAQQIAAEIAELPPAATVLPLIEALVSRG